MIDKSKLACLPSINDLMKQDKIKELITIHGQDVITTSARELLSDKRQHFLAGDDTVISNNKQENTAVLLNELEKAVSIKTKPSLQKVINATGTVLHTNLGRSNLSPLVMEHLTTIAGGYSNLEYDVANGKRGSRYDHLIEVVRELTGAEDALVVNNNAAAVLLVLDTLTKEKEVVVSRGELVEIGGSFRIPSVIEASGCYLKEVGTTNKTHLYDYEDAINENTGALLKVHTSNFKVVGFTDSVPGYDVCDLAKKHDIPYIEDLGSGLLVDLSKYGFSYEPTVMDVLQNGADVVTFSGDKILGGPQAGIIVGKKEYIDRMKRNQLTRVLRVDKMVIASLEATISLYRDQKQALEHIPTLQMLTMTKEESDARATEYAKVLEGLGLGLTITKKEAFSQVGGGSYPGEEIPSVILSLTSDKLSTSQLEEKLRQVDVPVVARIKDNELILDVRTISEADFNYVVTAFKEILS